LCRSAGAVGDRLRYRAVGVPARAEVLVRAEDR